VGVFSPLKLFVTFCLPASGGVTKSKERKEENLIKSKSKKEK